MLRKQLRFVLIASALAVPLAGCASDVPLASDDGTRLLPMDMEMDMDGVGEGDDLDPALDAGGAFNCDPASDEPCEGPPMATPEAFAPPYRGVSLTGTAPRCDVPVDSAASVCSVCSTEHCDAGTPSSCEPWPASPLLATACSPADEGERLPSCLDGWTALGDARVETGRLVPGGDLEAEAGFVMNTPSDVLTDAIELVATFAPGDGCEGLCELDTVGLGLMDSQEVPTEALSGSLPTRVALIYRAAAAEVIVRIAGDVITRIPFDAEKPVWALRALPDGTAVVLNGAAVTVLDTVAMEGEIRFEPSAAMRPVILGRTFNPSGTAVSVGVTEFVRRDLDCDTLDVWTDPASITVPMPVDGAPGLAIVGSETNFVVATSEGISVLTKDAQVLSTIAGEGLSAPSHIVVDGVHRVYVTKAGAETLYFEAAALDGPWSDAIEVLGAADADDDAFGLSSSTTGIIEATVAPHSLGPVIIAVEARGGKRSLVGFQHRAPHLGGAHAEAGAVDTVYEPIFSLGETGEEHRLGNLNVLLDRIGGADVANPSLIQYGGGWHLYVSVRFNSRVHTHLFTSAELLHWEHRGRVVGGERAEDEFGASGFDAGVMGGEVVGVYVGRSQVSDRLLLTSRTFDGSL